MKVLYQPKGRAGEYAGWALNVALGCPHGCVFCYAPKCLHMTREKFRTNLAPRTAMVGKYLNADCQTLATREPGATVFMSFFCDPFGTERIATLTGWVLSVIAGEGLRPRILTKQGAIVQGYIAQLAATAAEVGVSLNNLFPSKWEPYAPPPVERVKTLELAHDAGLYTWVSVEPTIDPAQALQMMKSLVPCGIVNEWRVGKLNHFPEIADKVDWKAYYLEASKVLAGQKIYWKKDLLEAAGVCHS